MYNFSAEFVPLTSLSRGDIIFSALLRRLCEANEPEKADKKTVESQKSVEDEDIIRLVAER